MLDLSPSESGCLLVADITGYTSYLQATELEHAQDVLADLLETLVGTLQPVFTLSKLEGDAAFSYAPEGRVSPTLILDTVEAGYFAFRRRLRDIGHASNCECNACVLIPSLDLKYFVHHGDYVARRIAGTDELTGSDVVLVHRLTKAEAGSSLGTTGFVVYTKKTLDTFGMNPELLGFTAFVERLADIGDVDVFVQDLTKVWAFENERNRQYLTEDEAEWSQTWPIPVSPEVAWDYTTAPEKRMLWNRDITSFEQQTPGRLTVGSVNHCMHGPETIIEHVADWRPFSYFTLDYPRPDLGEDEFMRMTYVFADDVDGSTMTLRIGGSRPGFKRWWDENSGMWLEGLGQNGEILFELWDQLTASER